MVVKITPNDRGNPPGKLADAELHFTDGPLSGLKLIGFAIWERRGGNPGRNVTFPARAYSVNGERRCFALLRPINDVTGQDNVRRLILEAYAAHEEQTVTAEYTHSMNQHTACAYGKTPAARLDMNPTCPECRVLIWDVSRQPTAPATPQPTAPDPCYRSDADARAAEAPIAEPRLDF